MTESREELLLQELGRDGGAWQKGEPVAITLRLAEAAVSRPDLVVAFTVAAKLLGRMSETVKSLHLVAPLVTPPRLALLLRAAGPLDAACATALARVQRVPITTTEIPGSTVIVVGSPRPGQRADLWCDADGWLALIGVDGGGFHAGAPVGAIVAVCLLVNDLFQLVHATTRHTARLYRFSAWDLRVDGDDGPDLHLDKLDLGAVNIAGAGAVTECALWSAAVAGITMAVTCGDHDTVDETNLGRLPFADLGDIDAFKTDVLERGLDGSTVTMQGEHRRFEELRAPLDRPLLFAVDDDQARETLQQLAPPLAISATTGTLALTIEWSDLDPRYACISCGHPIILGPSPEELAVKFGITLAELAGPLTPERVDAIEGTHGLAAGTLAHIIGRPACDELGEIARIALGIGAPTGSVAFLSWLAGVLLLVELIAHVAGRAGTRPRRRFLPLISPSALRAKNPKPRRECSCQSPFFADAYARTRRANVGGTA